MEKIKQTIIMSNSNNQLEEQEYIDLIRINDRNYLITKSIQEKGLNIIKVNEIIQDIYHEGYRHFYGNKTKSEHCITLEKYLNTFRVQMQILAGIPVVAFLQELKIKSTKPNMEQITKTRPTVISFVEGQKFEQMIDLLNCYGSLSFFELAQQVDEMTKQVTQPTKKLK